MNLRGAVGLQVLFSDVWGSGFFLSLSLGLMRYSLRVQEFGLRVSGCRAVGLFLTRALGQCQVCRRLVRLGI